MRTLGTLASPEMFPPTGGGLVGRTVATAQFIRALALHGSMESLALFVGESSEARALASLAESWGVPPSRVAPRRIWEMPAMLARGEIDALHHATHVDRLYDLLALRDRYATRATPVTGQIHSLSYPRMHQEHARWLLVPPSSTDALFCSSSAGRTTVERAFDLVEASAVERGLTTPVPRWGLPLVPLGVDVAALTGGAREGTRRSLTLPDDALVIVSIARFTEFDKADLFPLLHVLERLVHAPSPAAPDVYLVLAGARQGTRTPEMLAHWARGLGIAARVRVVVDFADADKRHLLAAGDVFVSPVDNVQETFGQSVIEAQAAGLACVVSDFDGYKDTVDDAVGIRVPTRLGPSWRELSELAPLLYERPLHLVLGQSVEVDLVALEDALRALAVDGPRRRRLGAAGAARSRARYDWRCVIAQMEAHWRALAAAPWRAAQRAHPLRLDYDALFGHFVTERIDEGRMLVAHPRRAAHVIYPELAALITADDVSAAHAWAAAPRSFGDAVAFFTARLGARPPWVAAFIATWMVKQGLLVDAR